MILLFLFFKFLYFLSHSARLFRLCMYIVFPWWMSIDFKYIRWSKDSDLGLAHFHKLFKFGSFTSIYNQIVVGFFLLLFCFEKIYSFYINLGKYMQLEENFKKRLIFIEEAVLYFLNLKKKTSSSVWYFQNKIQTIISFIAWFRYA